MRCTSGFVVYLGSFFVLWILMNQSFQSPHLKEGIVSLLYDSATEQWMIFVQNFKLYYMSTCRIFLPICRHEKKMSMTAQLCMSILVWPASYAGERKIFQPLQSKFYPSQAIPSVPWNILDDLIQNDYGYCRFMNASFWVKTPGGPHSDKHLVVSIPWGTMVHTI